MHATVILCAFVLASVVSATVLGINSHSELLKNGFVHTPGIFAHHVYKTADRTVLIPNDFKPASSVPEWHSRLSFTPPDPLRLDPFFAFIPVYLGSLMAGASAIETNSPCFAQTQFVFHPTSNDTGVIEVTGDKPTSELCRDLYLFATVKGWHLHEQFFRGTHSIEWHHMSVEEAADVSANGIRVFRFPRDETDTISDIYQTFRMFDGGFAPGPKAHVTADMEKTNLQFLKDHANVTMEPRPIESVFLDESQIHSGDFFGVIRLDGLDPMLAWAMGSATGHTTVAMWIDGELYVCESTSGWYWPKANIQRTPYRDWLKFAQDASFNVVHLPLRAEVRARFNETAALDWFLTVEGLQYGYRNMLFGWIDTPEDNYPLGLNSRMLQVGMSLVDTLVPSVVDQMWNEALNMRLGTRGLRTWQIYAEASARNISFYELVTMPEQDHWVYSDGYNMVCDVFVLELYKAAGLFGEITSQIQGTEFQNWDVYSLAFFDETTPRPAACVEADPDLTYCQILGKYRMHMKGYNTFEPYPHMRENCGGHAYDYIKAAGC
eukprot:TRINITY_DN5548_c0_g1_i1.p1 TRINITY_DN5548_c0_g1~~TRINITY_DN5548_c0_g1_i1.p1  ORF type:complete len:549 (-),score=103.23 TRINITY_DN5548_c0_g1_i1:70-1716(-)